MAWRLSAAVAISILSLSLLLIACGPDDTTPSQTSAPAQAKDTSAPTIGPTNIEWQDRLTEALVTRVVDGDTIDVLIEGEEFRVRYIGIDTPETVDPRRPVGCFGVEASQRNHDLVDEMTVGLEKDVSETDRFGRLLRYVWLDDQMVNAALVAGGYATASAYPPDVAYSDMFLDLQREAREQSLGLWSEVCSSPTSIRAEGECEYSGTSEPVIKGNISQSTDEKIYHVPGGDFYEVTIVDEAGGERWFCTESEGLSAGWRASLR